MRGEKVVGVADCAAGGVVAGEHEGFDLVDSDAFEGCVHCPCC